MTTTRVLISGASIAGPTLAYWLRRHGADVTVVERAPALRGGGQGVDLRGAQQELLRRMDIEEAVREAGTRMGEQVIVDADGRGLVRLPAALMSGEVEILRGDLSRILHDRTRHDTEYLFGDAISELRQDADGVDVTFHGGTRRRFDLVVGADGLHSRVRALAFGPEERYSTFLGYHAAGWTMPNDLGLHRSGLIYNEPGVGVLIFSGRDRDTANVELVLASPELPGRRGEITRTVAARCAGLGWQAPRLSASLDAAADLYLAPFRQIRLDRWSQGRVVLLGDAAWAAGPGGSGTGAAMLGAYVLAAELAAAGWDHPTAFARYEAALRPAATSGQKQARGAGPFLAPATQAKIRRRNRAYRLLSSRPLRPLFTKLTERAANTVTLDA